MFYPRLRPKGFDELRFYAQHFNTVEVNATFYGQPRAEVSRAWAQRTPPGFEFSVKLFQKFTHPRMFKATLGRALPVDITGEPALEEALDAIAAPNQADLDAFRRGIEPLATCGKLGALLAQFPPSFHDTEPARAYLADLLRAFAGHRVAVELRHRSWSDHIDGTLTLLNELGAAWVQIDEPKFTLSIRQNYLPNVRGFYYMRLHGRNAAAWWSHAHAEDRYNYLYSDTELREFSDVAGAARQLVKKIYLYTNNHFAAKAAANAMMLKRQLGQPVVCAREFVEQYPELAGVASGQPITALRLLE